MKWILLGWVMAMAAPTPEKTTGKGLLVTESVGQVGASVITSREVLIVGILDHWFLSKGTKKHEADRRDWLLQVGTVAFKRQLAQVMLEVVVVLEAESFSVAEISAEETKKTASMIQSELKDWSEWKKLEITQAELEGLVSRHQRAQSFLKFKTESAGAQVTEEEIRQYYDKNRVRFGNLPLSQFHENIKDYLTKQQLEDKLRDWFEVLKRKYRVRYLPSVVS